MARSIGTAAWMAFVDGENLTIRGQKVREAAGDAEFECGAWWEPDVFLWFPRTQLKQLRPGGTAREQTDGSRAFAEWGIALQENPTRAHYYTSAIGDAERLDSIWALGFEPNVFKKTRRNEKAKGVDIALTTAMVSHAHLENYEAAILVAPRSTSGSRERGAALGRGCILVGEVSDTNKELVRRYYEGVVNEHRLDELASFIHPDYVDHNAEDIERGPSVVRAHLEGLRSTFPDFRLRIEQMIAEDDLVVTRVTARGTHTGVWQEIKPTGAEIRLYGINIDRFEEGLIAEHWGEADTVGMLQQMGVDPFGAGSTD